MEKISYAGWQNCIRLKNSQTELIVTTDVGPRVIRYGFIGGENLFKEVNDHLGKTGGDQWRSYGGHRFWHAPESVPRTYAPDNDPISYDWSGNTLTLTQKKEASTGVSKQIEITVSEESGVRIVHRLRNENLWDIEAAPWCLSVLRQGGRAILPQEPFVPFPDMLLPVRPLVLWSYTDMMDPRFSWGSRFIQLRQDAKAKLPQKFGIRNTLGWGAYVRGNEVFLKLAGYRPEASYPDFGCNWEVYTNAEMLELETLGPYGRIPAGKAVEHVEQWFLFKKEIGTNDEEIAASLIPLVEAAKR